MPTTVMMVKKNSCAMDERVTPERKKKGLNLMSIVFILRTGLLRVA